MKLVVDSSEEKAKVIGACHKVNRLEDEEDGFEWRHVVVVINIAVCPTLSYK